MPSQAHKQHRRLPLYTAILKLYPKQHQAAYGNQMLQTMEDMLDNNQGASDRLLIWARVMFELPKNLVEEHINNMEDKRMGQLSAITKRNSVIVGSLILLAIVGYVVIAIINSNSFRPTTLSRIQDTQTGQSCLQTSANEGITIPHADNEFISNAAVMGITDVPAGTNADVFIKTYAPDTATGTVMYPDKYGSYNFTVTKSSAHSADSYTAGWEITSLKACKK